MSLLGLIMSLDSAATPGGGGGGTVIPITWAGGVVDIYGDSITANVNATSAANGYVNLFKTGKSITTINNYGISGQVIQGGTVCGRTVFDKTTITTHTTQAALIIALGVNDIGVNNGTMSAADAKTKLGLDIDYAIGTKGWPAHKIVLLAPWYVTTTGWGNYVGSCSVTTAADNTRAQQYVDAIQALATEKGVKFLDTYTLMKNTAGIDAMLNADDGLHGGNDVHQVRANILINNL